jgi:hypothetical protein
MTRRAHHRGGERLSPEESEDGGRTWAASGPSSRSGVLNFEARNYGYAKLSELTAPLRYSNSTPQDGKTAVIYVRDKRYPKRPQQS